MLEIRNLVGGWDTTTVVQRLSLTVQAGETMSIVGRNGVGKTTLLELIMGRTRHRSGEILIDGKELLTGSICARARLGLGYVPQQREIFPSLTVAEHLLIAKRPGRWSERSIYDLFPKLASRRDSFGRQLSGGEQQMLSIARCLIGNPRILLMDEPSEGLAPVVVEQMVEAIRSFVGSDNLAVILVEQRVDIAVDLSTRCLVMDRGQIVHESPSDVLRRNPARIAELMGLAGPHTA